ncbi:hypothetical protein HanHA300_Chr04g0147071 [Helianthus annuus]|nr:hypothetical protein HanHA300_Chr04g0147071 [Helianthus annuus]KAJ0597950.1 hypothetical protein HanHA89_Chr04g0160431 [Helianthus annuus]KAJ0758579.1 hypothetical protein HanLR1_Chr04g0151991 [Helianthus annuus]
MVLKIDINKLAWFLLNITRLKIYIDVLAILNLETKVERGRIRVYSREREKLSKKNGWRSLLFTG